jgi:hypothetical protein
VARRVDRAPTALERDRNLAIGDRDHDVANLLAGLDVAVRLDDRGCPDRC